MRIKSNFILAHEREESNMKDVMASLPEVIKEYKGYNLLIPTATDVQLNHSINPCGRSCGGFE